LSTKGKELFIEIVKDKYSFYAIERLCIALDCSNINEESWVCELRGKFKTRMMVITFISTYRKFESSFYSVKGRVQ
jgi:hypothetical protein